MRRLLPLLIAGMLSVLVLVAWWVGREAEPARPDPGARVEARDGGRGRGGAATSDRAASGPRAERPSEEARARGADRRAKRARRDETLAKINAALRARAEAEAEDEARRRDEARAAALPAQVDAAPQVGDLNDRSGNRGYLLEVMNAELMPLLDECYELAKVDAPDLEGLLALDVEVVGDEAIGGVVEAVATSEQSELANAELIECARESLFATTLPPPPESGRDAFMLSLRLGPDGAP